MSRFPFLKFMILNYLKSYGELTGYSFMKYCEEMGIPASSGTVYPHLKNMLDAGLVAVREEGKRKVYTLTEEGNALAETSYANAPEFLKKAFFANLHLSTRTDWKSPADVEKFINNVDQIRAQISRYLEELKRAQSR